MLDTSALECHYLTCPREWKENNISNSRTKDEWIEEKVGRAKDWQRVGGEKNLTCYKQNRPLHWLKYNEATDKPCDFVLIIHYEWSWWARIFIETFLQLEIIKNVIHYFTCRIIEIKTVRFIMIHIAREHVLCILPREDVDQHAHLFTMIEATNVSSIVRLGFIKALIGERKLCSGWAGWLELSLTARYNTGFPVKQLELRKNSRSKIRAFYHTVNPLYTYMYIRYNSLKPIAMIISPTRFLSSRWDR